MYLIRDAEIADVYALAKCLRDGDRLEITSLGLTPAVGLRRSFKNALYRKTALIADPSNCANPQTERNACNWKIAAMWGLGGTAFGNTGYPWLMTAPVIESLPVSFVREARRELGRMMAMHRCLTGWVAADYAMACRFLDVLGFALGDVELIGPKRARFRQFTMER